MRIAVFGLGYVGSITAACLASEDHTVVGVDLNRDKVKLINSGEPPVREPGLADLLASVVSSGSLTATTEAEKAVQVSDLALVCVGTPSNPDGSLNLAHVAAVMRTIGHALREREGVYTIVLRSTALPGTTRDLVIPILEKASGKSHMVDFEVCFNPEFLREGTSLYDYANPPKIVVGTHDGKPNSNVAGLYSGLDAPLIETTYEVAELAKYVDNTWHALKVTFANDVARFARAHDIDSREVMDIMTGDTKLNMSPKYLRPGYAYGGSCLPKDVSALVDRSSKLALETPVFDAIQESNRAHIQYSLDLISGIEGEIVGCLGLSFKADTDDVRNSPVVDLLVGLAAQGRTVLAYDPNIDPESMLGANRDYLLGHLPDIDRVLVGSPEELFKHADVLVLTKSEPALVQALRNTGEHQTVVDLVGLSNRPERGSYVGIGW